MAAASAATATATVADNDGHTRAEVSAHRSGWACSSHGPRWVVRTGRAAECHGAHGTRSKQAATKAASGAFTSSGLLHSAGSESLSSFGSAAARWSLMDGAHRG